MQCAVMDLCCVRVAVVKASSRWPTEIAATNILNGLQPRFGHLPILLVSFDEPDLSDIRGYSGFPTDPYLADMVEWHSLEPINWQPLPKIVEPALPF